jgi:hypothetical protein
MCNQTASKQASAHSSKPLRTTLIPASLHPRTAEKHLRTHAQQKSTQPLRNFCSGKPLKDDGLLHQKKTPKKKNCSDSHSFLFFFSFPFWSRVGAFDCLSMMLLLCGYVVVFFGIIYHCWLLLAFLFSFFFKKNLE